VYAQVPPSPVAVSSLKVYLLSRSRESALLSRSAEMCIPEPFSIVLIA
jgi:hypothetical protein